MTAHGRASPDPPTDSEAHEELLKRLRDSGASAARIGEAAMAYLEHLLDIEHPHLAAWHAGEYAPFWDDERKLDILERMWRIGMESFAITLCHRWRLSERCHKTRHEFFRKMFPKLPPRPGDPT
ncbi:MAG TPA: hypothetical protein VL283_05695 [Candidatus Baltobacteraceae bacterium]|jgi:hypothetical protein|nr:hypothetical protein [Candidatus Baltobacteraceae bacterium]